MANWPRVAGLPTPDAEPWMLRDVPITRSTLECLKSNSLVERAGQERVSATATARATRQMTYQTKRHDSVFRRIDEYTALPIEAAEAFAARPDADVYVVEVFAWIGATVANEIRRVEDEFNLDVQLVGVGIEEPSEYPGTFLETTRDDLLDASSPILRAIPCKPDILVTHPRITYRDVGATVLDRTDATEHLVKPDDGMLDPVIRNLLVDDEVTFDTDGKDEYRQTTLEEMF